MMRIALIVALLSVAWSPAPRCLAPARAAEVAAPCHHHEGTVPEPAKTPLPDCAGMACCQAVLLPAAVTAPAPEPLVLPALVAVAVSIAAPPDVPAEIVPAVSPGPPGVLLAVSRLGRAPPLS